MSAVEIKMEVDPAMSNKDSEKKTRIRTCKIIQDPRCCIVQNQIPNTGSVKMLVIHEDQKLFTFAIPEDNSTVQDLLDAAGISFCENMIILLVTNPTSNSVNYIVDIKGNRQNRSNLSLGLSATSDPFSHILSPSARNSICSSPKKEEKKRPLQLEGDESGPLEKRRGKIPPVAEAGLCKVPAPLTLSQKKDQDEAKLEKSKVQNSNSTLADVDKTSNQIKNELILENGSQSVITNRDSASTISEHGDSNKEGIKGRDVMYKVKYVGCDSLIEAAHTALRCKVMMVGSHFYIPQENVIISKSGIRLRAPLINDNLNCIPLEIKIENIEKLIIWVEENRRLVLLYLTPNAVNTMDDSVRRKNSNGCYFDLAGKSKEILSPHVTLLLQELTEESRVVMETLFAPNKFLQEVTHLGTMWTLKRRSHEDAGSQIKSSIQRLEQTTATVDNTLADDKTQRILKNLQSLIQRPEQTTSTLNDTEERDILCEVQSMAYHNSTLQAPYTSLVCKSVRIGSYEYTLEEAVIISHSGVTLGVPLCRDNTIFIPLLIKLKAIVKVLIHFDAAMPVLFIKIRISTADILRKLLGMCDPKGPYYNPSSNDTTQKWITFMPEKMSVKAELFLKNLFSSNNLLKELSSEEAKSILAKKSPKNGSLSHSLFENDDRLDVVKTEVKFENEENFEIENEASTLDYTESDENMTVTSELASSSSAEKKQTIASADTKPFSDSFWNVWMTHT